jgi:hypothetical protein
VDVKIPDATWPLFCNFLIIQSEGLLGRRISPPHGRYLHRTTHRINADINSLSGIQPTNPVFEWVKTIHALDCEGTVIGMLLI